MKLKFLFRCFHRSSSTSHPDEKAEEPSAAAPVIKCGCGWIEGRGFVPEAGCPIHDMPIEDFWKQPSRVHEETLRDFGCHLVLRNGHLKWVRRYDTIAGDFSIVI